MYKDMKLSFLLDITLVTRNRTSQSVPVAKDEGLISDKANHELRMTLTKNQRDVLLPIHALKQERNRQNRIIALHSIPQVSENKCNLFKLHVPNHQSQT